MVCAVKTPDYAPTFFIIGAPRCGTTALSEYLRGHPLIGFATPKETQYFCTDIPEIRYVQTEDEYLSRCFGHCAGKNYKAIGDGSVWHLYSEQAVSNILRFNPTAKFIIMVRNPLDLIPSLHNKLYELLDEDMPNFKDAWNLQGKRANGYNVPKRCHDVRLLQYASIGKLGFQIARAFNQIPENKRHVIVFEDFVKDTANIYSQVLEFIDVNNDGRCEFPKINENKRVKNRWFWDLAWNPPVMLVAIVSLLKKAVGIKAIGLLPRLRGCLLEVENRPPLSQEMRKVLKNEFSADIRLLSQLLRRDLSQWMDG